MKTKEYVTKYGLDKSNGFSHNDFIADFTMEFITLLEVGNNTKSFSGYESAVKVVRQKWDAISNKTVYGLPDKLWGYFYATVIAKTKEELFPEHIAKLNAEREEKKQFWEERKREREREDAWIWGFLFSSMLTQKIKPTDSFDVLGLNSNASKEDVNKKYRELSLLHHPDKGGNSEMFLKITEAKNKVMSFLS